jgi:N-acetylneuraminic acid mutarotase
MASPRSEFQVAVVDGLIYAPGGLVNTSGRFQGSAEFEVYDPVADRWRSLAPLYARLHHLQVAAHEGRVYLFGGMSDCEACEPHTMAYDPASDAWTQLGPMPDWRSGGAAVTVGDYIYLVGGWGERTESEGGSDLLRYEPATDTWTERAPLNERRDHVNAVAYNGKIYAFGGRWRSGDLRSMEVYDPVADTWTAGPEMRDARAGHAAAVVGDRLYVAGGELISQSPAAIVATVEVFDPALNSWVEHFEMPVGLHGVPAAGIDGVLYLVGGSTAPAGVSNDGAVWAYRP